eukprot:TRINITY_DN511_c0_g1_i2.p1 TRINITY_DN511_c0_g1~~TRINITY_DN511_c0_g1_i2.p1  ORF type:complete len:175 (-),score=35.31 TRINITY_DN511_c0_g1_i2:115-639(-)
MKALLVVTLLAFATLTYATIGGKDANGCLGAAGYVWCQPENKCVRPWELAKVKNMHVNDIKDLCNIPNNKIGGKVDDHGCLGSAGYIWCSYENQCVRPWELAKQHNFSLSMENVQSHCDNQSELVGGAVDDHGCIGSAGYSWCEKENQCVRPWELAKAKALENTPEDFQAYCSN